MNLLCLFIILFALHVENLYVLLCCWIIVECVIYQRV